MKPITQENSRLGFVGIGNMGRPIARRLLESGFKVAAYDRDHNKAEELIPYGGTVAQSVSELSSNCNVVLSCLPNDEAVLDIYGGLDGVFAHANRGLVVIDLSTVYPEASQQLSTLGSERGVAVLDVTISGSTPAAENGLLTLFGGGDKERFDAAESIFRVIAKKYFYLGPSGSGATMKLVVNTLLGIGMQAIAEAVALGEKAGLNRIRLLGVLSQTAVVAPAYLGKLERAMKSDYSPQFPIRLMNKDFGLILELANAVGARMPAAGAAFEINTRQSDEGSEQDFSAVILQMEKRAHLGSNGNGRTDRRSEAYLAEAQRLSHTGSFGWKPSTGEIIWSEETFRIFQYDPTMTPTVELVLQRVHPEDAALVQQTIERAEQDGKDFDHEYRLVMPDSFLKYIHVVAHALRDESAGIEFVGAVMDVTAAKQVEKTLKESAAYLAEAQRLTHTGSAAWQVAGRSAVNLSEEWYRIYGFDPKEGPSAWEKRLQRMHPEDRAKWGDITDRAIREKADYEGEHRILLPDGTLKYTRTVGHPVLNASGAVEQFVCTMMDVTERKVAEAALASVNRRLIEAQENERTRIAGELHDDIGQRLALLAVQLQQLQEDTLILPEVRSRMGEFQKQMSEIADDIQFLSHELHSAKLQYLGIAGAIRGFCQEFSEQQKVEIDFNVHDLPRPLSPDISLCLFRVLQEALHNSAKHSGVRHFEVRLWGTSDEIHLTVRDSGSGFDVEEAMKTHGLGVVSMRERLKLVDGQLSIDSQPQQGTTVHARVPLCKVASAAS